SSGSALSSRASDVSAGARGEGAAREQRHSCKIICVAICKVVLVTIALGFSCRGQTSQQSSPRPSTSGAQSLFSSAIKEIEADLQAGRFNEAQAKTEAIIKTQPNNALAWVYLGMASLELEQTEQAIQAFERAIAINPKDPI